MSASLVAALSESAPLAVIFALQPLSMVSALVALRSAHPRSTGLAFLAGWLLSIAALTGLCAEAFGRIGWPYPLATVWIRIGVGTVLIAFGGFRILRRERPHAEPEWVHRLSTLTPTPGMLTAGVLLLVNPVAIFLCVTAGLMISVHELPLPTQWQLVLCFTAVAGSSVAISVLTYLVAGSHPAAVFARLRCWVQAHPVTVSAGLPIAFGALLLFRGVTGR
ncbi:pheromone shutdown protein TraB [Mycobacterium sp. MAA66]|uniref:GAP family protein n=1 Tax=Mycobacterium sp. MAA66 TaxID=3156297 RepID=UPI0035178138